MLAAEHATPTDRRWMTRALELARQAAARGEVPVGAVVYDTTTGEQIAEASNTRQQSNDPTGHAELLAVRAAAATLDDWRLTGCTVVVTLEPCPMCAGMLVNARVGRVVYGADDPKAGACRSLFAITTDTRLNHCCEVVAGLEAERCGRVLTEFFRQRRHEQRAARTPLRAQHNDHNAEAPDDA
ncbi:MAG: tRNA adenosine(34) deaminase TadA [Planctomycetota bacterium]|nr:tRNA adenosine(34) deaminase TadA [Planctomycetota bacterium]